MNKIFLLPILLSFNPLLAQDKRADDIRSEMWKSGDKAFSVRDIPKKWAEKSAVIIAQSNRFEYRKVGIGKILGMNQHAHYRIKLNDQNSVTKYSEMSYGANVNSSNGEFEKTYTGYKVVKPNGAEQIVDLSKAVKMERSSGGQQLGYYKIAIPGLEPGDILDYYVCEEAGIYAVALHFFSPVIHSLPREYPLMNYKLQFLANRKCYINLKSLNGAPPLKLAADEKNDEQYYSFEGADLESFEDQRWTFPYRDLPTIKFRAAFAHSEKVVDAYDVLLGEQKIAKTEVKKKELEELTATMVKGTYYELPPLMTYWKKKLSKLPDHFEVATEAYYFLRNTLIFRSAEQANWEGRDYGDISRLRFTGMLSAFLRSKKIPHDIIVAVPRSISPIADVIMEQEIEWLIRVKKGTQYLYLAPFSIHSIPGKIQPLLEGTEAYALDGLIDHKKWNAQTITLPVSASADNRSETNLTAVIAQGMTTVKSTVKKTVTGSSKGYHQYVIMDYYDFEKEENGKFPPEPSRLKLTKQEQALKKAYLDKRISERAERFKKLIEDEYEFKIKPPEAVTIEQAGRFGSTPAMVYNYSFDSEDLMKRAGLNYIFDVGKLIEGQVKIEGDELKRHTNINFDNARSFVCNISFAIPNGYMVDGLEKLNQSVVNKYGGFTSTAKIDDGKVVIETNKRYDVNFVPKADWQSVVDFLNAAYDFSEQKLLLRKK
jgi:hypothetical protein